MVTWKISMKDKVSSGLIRKRCQFTQGYVLLAMCSSRILTDNKLFHLTRVCFVFDCKWCCVQRKSKGVKGWGDEVEVTQLLNMLAPQLFMSALHLDRFHSRGQQLCKFLGTKETFLQEKRLQSHIPPFKFFCTPIWPPWRHMKTLCGFNIAHFLFNRTK